MSLGPRTRKVVLLLGTALFWLAMAQSATAQVTIDPTAKPTKDTGGWVYWMAEGAIVLGGIILILAAFAYLRFAPRFSRDEEDGKPRAGVRAPQASVGLQTQWAQAQPVVTDVVAVPAPQPVAVGAAAPAAAQAPAAGAAAPAAAPTAAPAGGASASAPAAARPPRSKGEPIELDQETFDRVLAEQLAKGTDRRVAEGRARSAAAKAAREKAGGE